jgi:hypothetical protein
MQYSVPQFTDVEDRIIGALTIKQFGIIMIAGVAVFIIFTLTKSIVATIFTGIILGIPAIALAFGKINGRPIYSGFFNFFFYFIGPKIYAFHKEAKMLPSDIETKVEVHEAPKLLDAKAATKKIKQLNYLLQQRASEEATLLEHMNDGGAK